MTDQSQADDQIVIELWSDLTCPWCFVGKHRLQEAIAQRPDADRFRVEMRAFELDPTASSTPRKLATAFAESHNITEAQFLKMEGGVQSMAQGEGLAYTVDRMVANTMDVHRVAKYADAAGLGTAFFAAVQDAYFAGEVNPFDPEQLLAVATAVGLDPNRVAEVLAGTEFADDVRADEDQARRYGVRGVPFTVYDGRFATSGAQPLEGYLAALAEAAPLPQGAK